MDGGSDLLLQADDTGPLLLQQPLIFLAGSIVEGFADAQLVLQRLSTLRVVGDGEVCYDCLVPVPRYQNMVHLCVTGGGDVQLIGLALGQKRTHGGDGRIRSAALGAPWAVGTGSGSLRGRRRCSGVDVSWGVWDGDGAGRAVRPSDGDVLLRDGCGGRALLGHGGGAADGLRGCGEGCGGERQAELVLVGARAVGRRGLAQ